MNQPYFAIGTIECNCSEPHQTSFSILYRPPQESIAGLTQSQADDGYETCTWRADTVRVGFEVPILSNECTECQYYIFIATAICPETQIDIHVTALAESVAQVQLLLADMGLIFKELDSQFRIQHWRYTVVEDGKTVKTFKKYVPRVLETICKRDGRVQIKNQLKDGKWKNIQLDYKLYVLEEL